MIALGFKVRVRLIIGENIANDLAAWTSIIAPANLVAQGIAPAVCEGSVTESLATVECEALIRSGKSGRLTGIESRVVHGTCDACDRHNAHGAALIFKVLENLIGRVERFTPDCAGII